MQQAGDPVTSVERKDLHDAQQAIQLQRRLTIDGAKDEQSTPNMPDSRATAGPRSRSKSVVDRNGGGGQRETKEHGYATADRTARIAYEVSGAASTASRKWRRQVLRQGNDKRDGQASVQAFFKLMARLLTTIGNRARPGALNGILSRIAA